LLAFYGVILSFGAKTISDGSELLLELFPKWGTVVGALLLPVLGAVPDSAIIIMSGAFGTVEEAQEQVSVGVGTLAGSTIMLLTVPWAASMMVARCDLDLMSGEAIDGQCNGLSLTRQGVTVDEDTPTNSKIMLITSLAYFIVQGIAFAYVYDPEGNAAHKVESPFALVGFIACVILLLGYCVYQVMVPKLAEKRQQKLEQMREERVLRLRALHILQRWNPALAAQVTGAQQSADESAQSKALHAGLKWKRRVDKDKDPEKQPETTPLLEPQAAGIQDPKKAEEEEEAEEDPRQHFGRNLTKSFILMILGTAICAFFSDPMVDVITDFGEKIHIGAFFVAFLITPYCSNASELISSLIFAAKKTKDTSSMTFSQLYGAACMNNTMCLGIFFALVYFRGLAWAFTAETVSILISTWIIGAITAFRRTFKLYWIIPVILVYPGSLLFVYMLESIAKWT